MTIVITSVDVKWFVITPINFAGQPALHVTVQKNISEGMWNKKKKEFISWMPSLQVLTLYSCNNKIFCTIGGHLMLIILAVLSNNVSTADHKPCCWKEQIIKQLF